MSKATDWAALRPPTLRLLRCKLFAEVLGSGAASVSILDETNQNLKLTPGEALELGKWLCDVYAEGSQPKEPLKDPDVMVKPTPNEVQWCVIYEPKKIPMASYDEAIKHQGRYGGMIERFGVCKRGE